jgi:hypothetical protein
MEFSCGDTTVTVRGGLIAPVTTNKMLPTINLKAKASKGQQKPESFVGGPKDVLEASFDGGAYEAIGLSVSVAEENGEELEVNTVT